MSDVTASEIEIYISERSKILATYKLLHERMIRALEAYETSLRKVPILTETAIIAGKQTGCYGASYGGASYEAEYLAKQEVVRRLDICQKFISESELVSIKVNEIQNLLNAEDKKFLELMQREWQSMS